MIKLKKDHYVRKNNIWVKSHRNRKPLKSLKVYKMEIVSSKK